MNNLFFLVLLASLSVSLVLSEDFYSLSAKDIFGQEVKLEKYRGKVSLVVNVASECGYTEYNYEQLTLLQRKYGPQHLVVLGFPCNQFGYQEPASEETILAMAQAKYKVNFPLFSKVDVTGEEQAGVYRFLAEKSGKVPGWNFCKYLVNQKGNVVGYFSQTESFDAIYRSINLLLEKQEL